MGSATPGLVASFFFITLLATGFVVVLYQVEWPLALAVGMVGGVVVVLLLRNMEKNLKKWRERPTTFPNPLGGGIVGEYMNRPWMQELAEIGRTYGKRRSKRARKSKAGGAKQNGK